MAQVTQLVLAAPGSEPSNLTLNLFILLWPGAFIRLHLDVYPFICHLLPEQEPSVPVEHPIL